MNIHRLWTDYSQEHKTWKCLRLSDTSRPLQQPWRVLQEKQPLLLELLVVTVPGGGNNGSLAIKQNCENPFNPFCAPRQKHKRMRQGALGRDAGRGWMVGGRKSAAGRSWFTVWDPKMRCRTSNKKESKELKNPLSHMHPINKIKFPTQRWSKTIFQ